MCLDIAAGDEGHEHCQVVVGRRSAIQRYRLRPVPGYRVTHDGLQQGD